MNFLKKTVSVAVSAMLLASSAAAVSSFTASAAEEGVTYTNDSIYKWAPIDRHYGWGEGPGEVTYSDNGYAVIKDLDRGFKQQLQVAYGNSMRASVKKELMASILEATSDDHDGDIGCDITLRSCENTNFSTIEKKQNACAFVAFGFGYTDKQAVTKDNPDGFVHATSFASEKNWVSIDKTNQYTVTVDELADINELVQSEENYGDLAIEDIQIKVINYDCNRLGGDKQDIPDSEIPEEYLKYKGQKGLGNVICEFSPLYYADGKTLRYEPIGQDTGKGFELKEDKDGKVYFDFGEYGAYYQDTEEAQGDGIYGNGHNFDIKKPYIESSGLYGDANGDKKVTAADVLLIRKKVAGQKVTIDETVCDVNFDKKITAADVLLIRRHIAGQSVAPWNTK